MGFYGNITNVNDVSFSFDKVYSSKKVMEDNVSTDGVYIGRYVLVEYDNDPLTFFARLYQSGNRYFFDDEHEQPAYYIRPDTTSSNEVISHGFIMGNFAYFIDSDNVVQFIKCVGELESDDANEKPLAKFEVIEDFSGDYASGDNYMRNYFIDKQAYGTDIGKGWDGVVFQKIYQTNGEQYVAVAELNSVVPTLGITVDAPTTEPIPPHFSGDSSTIHYNLHIQPSWGFRVKKLEDNSEQLSDVQIQFSEASWDEVTDSFVYENRDYKGAIYFNKEGFNSDYRLERNEENEENFISVLPTGSSGRNYYKHQINTNNSSENNNSNINNIDIQELEIYLPGLGNTVSQLWNLVYGEGIQESEGSNIFKRNKNISWNDTTGLRMVSLRPSGFGYNPEYTETIVGTINSVHDLMGMIVSTMPKNNNINDALIDRIYYDETNGKYYIKDLIYERITENDGKIKESMIDFIPGQYFSKDDNNYYYQEKYQLGNKYYELIKDQENPNVKQVKLYEEPWEYKKYYIQDENENYIRIDEDTNKQHHPDKDTIYYRVNFNENDVEIIVDNIKGSNNRCFFPLDYNQDVFNRIFPTIEGRSNEENQRLFFQYKDKNNKIGWLPVYHPDDKSKPTGFPEPDNQNKNTPFYYIVGYTIETSGTQLGEIENVYDISGATMTQVNFDFFDDNAFYYQNENNNWNVLKKDSYGYLEISVDDIDNKKVYIKKAEKNKEGLKFIQIEKPFYKSNTYYYNDNKNYLLSTNEIKQLNIDYYTITEERPKEGIFYEPNKYYYQDKNNWYLDTNQYVTPDRDYYYNIFDKYVFEDPSGNYNIGEKWNINIDEPSMDSEIKIYPRKETFQWKELVGFSRTLNTINGLILEINNFMKFDDELTRDNKTVQGCINQMNDIINKIDQLKPSHFIAVDEYGRMTSMEPEGDKWISVKVNEDNGDKVVINHKFNKYIGVGADEAGNTTDAKDLNKEEENPEIDTDTIELYTPHVDEKGHIIGYNTTTTTLPYSYKYFKDSEESAGQTRATKTKDTLTLEGDKWIKPIVSQCLIKYSHIGPETSNETEKPNETPNFGDTFEIEDWYFDATGHKSNKTTHTVTIPQGSLTDTTASGSDVITQLAFEPTKGALSTTRTNITALKLDGYEVGQNEGDILATDTLGKALGKLQTQINNEEQARADAISNLDFSDTESKTKFVSKVSQEDGKISVSRADGGTLVLGKKYLSLNLETAPNDLSITEKDDINSAFSKLEYRLNSLGTASKLDISENDVSNWNGIYQIKNSLITSDTKFIYRDNQREGDLLLDILKELHNRIESLENNRE